MRYLNLWPIFHQSNTFSNSQESIERGEENELIIERILTLIRNVIQVPPDENEKRANNDATVHDEVCNDLLLMFE